MITATAGVGLLDAADTASSAQGSATARRSPVSRPVESAQPQIVDGLRPEASIRRLTSRVIIPYQCV